MSKRPHKNLEVWKESIKLTTLIYNISKNLPEDEKYGIISQIKRASVSIPANIAEGAARNSDREFHQYLSIASGSASERDALTEVLYELDFIDEFTKMDLLDQINKVSALLHGLRKSIYNKLDIK